MQIATVACAGVFRVCVCASRWQSVRVCFVCRTTLCTFPSPVPFRVPLVVVVVAGWLAVAFRPPHSPVARFAIIMSLAAKAAATGANSRRSNRTVSRSNVTKPAESIELELFGPVATDPLLLAVGTVSSPPASPPTAVTAKAGGAKASSKAAMQRLASSFVALNKRKADKRDRDQGTWKSLIQNALELQKGKIPLLLAVEAGNQSMCRELLSSQTVDQLKVSVRCRCKTLNLNGSHCVKSNEYELK